MAQATAETKPVAAKPPRGGFIKSTLDALTIPVLAIFTALICSGLIIAFTDPDVLALLPQFWQRPLQLLAAIWYSMWTAYYALFQGALGDPAAIVSGFRTWLETGNATPL